MIEIAPGATRRIIAKATHEEHLLLHSHPWISRLTQSPLHPNDYTLLLSAYYQFFKRIEESRLRCGAFESLSVEISIAALHKDLQELDALPDGETRAFSFLNTKEKVLGALYVMHGSGFGGRQMNANIQQELPDAPRHYFGQTSNSTLWQELVRSLDEVAKRPASQQILIVSVAETFSAFGGFVTTCCEETR